MDMITISIFGKSNTLLHQTSAMFILSTVVGGVIVFHFVKQTNVRVQVFQTGTEIHSPVDVVTILLFCGGLFLPGVAHGGL